MQWYNLILGNQSRYRYGRHAMAWLLWWVYIAFTVFATQQSIGNTFYLFQPGLIELGLMQYSLLVLIKSFLLLLSHLFFCYITIYYLLPQYLLKNKYIALGAGIILLSIICIALGYFLYSVIYPAIDILFHLDTTWKYKNVLWASMSAGLIGSIKVTLIAAAIALLKHWYLKQKEKEKLEKEKINAELQLLKAQIHPAFLFSTLNNIIEHATVASPRAPEMLIKLADLLSYMLYECDAPKVSLEKEIGMLKEYMFLEKIRQGDSLEMTFQIKGNVENLLISPLLLLPFIDNSFSYCTNERVEQAWINLDITIENNSLTMRLITGMPVGSPGDTRNDEQVLSNVIKRLQLLYPGRYELKINAEQELLMVYLNLTLEEKIAEVQFSNVTTIPLNYAAI